MLYLEKHGTHEGHLLVDGCAAEDVASTQGQGDVLDHVRKELEVFHQTHEVHRSVCLA